MTDETNPNQPPTAGRPPRRFGRARSNARRVTAFVAGVAATFLAIALYGIVNPGTPPLTTSDVNQAVASYLASQTPAPPNSELVYAAIQPSIVMIQTDRATAAVPAASPAAGGSAAPGGTPRVGLGTGVIVNDTGAILTALHIIDGASTITITFPDGTTTNASVASKVPESDIAVLQPEHLSANAAPATLGNPSSMRIGSEAYIVGNPFGLYGSLSAGVVSGLDRTFQLPSSGREIKGLIQVDAAINPGNSGGPLLDRNGQVVGIVTALVNPTGQDVFIGIGLAVPIDVAGGAAGLPAY
jgi:S1-C subfamily serine protease